MGYGTGDCLAVFAHNEEDHVLSFLDRIGLNPASVLNLQRTDGKTMELPTSMPLV